MSLSKTLNVKSLKPDKVLLLAFIIGFIFCLYGITWTEGHPDDMAFRPLFLPGKSPFNPGWFHKPPFHTYFNYFLSTLPIETIGKLFNVSSVKVEFAKVIWSRVLTSVLFLLSISLVFQVILKSFGIFSARIVALVFATSAGFIAYSHFLTSDIPVMFWMLLAFYFSFNILSRTKLSDYLLAGFFTGIATATKYNGLAIGISIAVAHLLSCSSGSWETINWKQLFLSKKIYLGLSMVIVGFVAGNPFCLLDYQTFKNDFVYNYMVTPVYDGQTGHSYGSFFWHVLEIIGLPSFIFCLTAMAFSIVLTVTRKIQDIQTRTILISLPVLLLYYYEFASFPRLETRFVLPLVPFFLILSAVLWNQIKQYKIIVTAFLFIIIGYNVLCDFYVGSRFLDDPRTHVV
jgi:4-amino-4-deoxy-L-arabinose transferase-like glycosyltransferase